MDVKTAAAATLPFIDLAIGLPADHPAYGRSHLRDMVAKILSWDVGDEKWNRKANRWIGWIQCAVVIGGGASLDDMKRVNREA
jgi:hypothetical protein